MDCRDKTAMRRQNKRQKSRITAVGTASLSKPIGNIKGESGFSVLSIRKATIVSSAREEDRVKENRGQPTPKQSCGGREEIQRDAKRTEEEGSRAESRDSVSSVSRQTRDES